MIKSPNLKAIRLICLCSWMIFLSYSLSFAQHIDLDDQNYSGLTGEALTFTVSITNAPNSVESLGFEIHYDTSVLEFDSINRGELTEDWTLFDASPIDNGIRIGGINVDELPSETSGTLATITFDILKSDSITLQITNRVDDISSWTLGSGTLIFTDTDDDGIPDYDEDANHDGVVDSGETDPFNIDTDGDGIQDGTESGYTLDDIGPDTDTGVFQPDLDPTTTSNPLNPDSDGDGLNDGGASGEEGGDKGACFVATSALGFEGHIAILRQFRVMYLLKSEPGQALVDAYCRYSPPVAEFIARHDILRAVVRWSLLPLYGL